MGVLTIVKKGLFVHLMILGIGLVYATQTKGVSVLLSLVGIATIILIEVIQAGRPPKVNYEDTLTYAKHELQISRERVRELERILDQVSSSAKDTQKIEHVLRMVAFHLVAYERQGGRISGDQTLRHLKGAMNMLGEGYLKEETADWNPSQWAEFYDSVNNFR